VAKFCYKPFEDLVIQKAKLTEVFNPPLAERTKLYEQATGGSSRSRLPWFTIAHAVQLKPVRKKSSTSNCSPFGRHTFYGVDISFFKSYLMFLEICSGFSLIPFEFNHTYIVFMIFCKSSH
jgi:hypothetical protein